VAMRTNLAGDANPGNDRTSRITTISFDLLAESFESATFPPDGWVVYNNDGGTQQWQRSTTAPRTGLAHASCRWETSTLQNDDWLVTPQFALPSGGGQLKFWYRVSTVSTPTDQLVIRLSTTNNTIPAFTVVLDSFSLTNNTYMEKVISLNSYAGQNIHLAFVSRGLYAWTIYLDDIVVQGQVGVEEEMPTQVLATMLYAPKPNPVTNGMARISYSLAQPSRVKLSIYDASGRVVRTLVNAQMESGIYNLQWNGRDEQNQKVAEGIYFYTLETPSYTATKKMVFTR
ncbi:MAG: choice-of-anchor J domain-containing protein, partial [Candidatus Latescibacteria bacterium]|nr:choice-of-anchor J domain-containing protein [Candidatus Latescibacterota bacterium]